MNKKIITRPTDPARARGQRTLASREPSPAVTAGNTLNTIQNIRGNNCCATVNGNITVVNNSDQVIIKMLDEISQQRRLIGELTDRVLTQASEIVELKLKLTGIEI